jgi:hypothetical protein
VIVNLASYIIAGIVVAVIVIAGFGGAFTDEHTKDESIPKKLAIGAGSSVAGIWGAAIWVILIGVLIAFFLNGGAEPAP